MCVTNTTHRRSQAITLNQSQVSVCPSIISQRLLGCFPQNAAPAKPVQLVQNFDAFPLLNRSSVQEKTRPKRRRKPQKPGKTAKLNDRHFVVHDYHDHAKDDVQQEEPQQLDSQQRRRGGVAVPFPLKLHAVLDQVEADGLADVISWQGHGRCFVVHKPKEFVDYVMPKYFRQTKLTSFQRQLNLYGFNRLTRGKDAGGYYHELFLRGKPFLCKQMTRTKVKGTRFKAASSPELEPDFYTMEPIVVTPPGTSDEEQSHDSEYTDDSVARYSNQAMSYHQVNYQRTPEMPIELPAASISYTVTSRYPEEDILDEAVDELFLQEAVDDENLADFVHDWDPNSSATYDALQDDSQLGFMLERLLED